MQQNSSFHRGDLVVYPSHGVGILNSIEEETIAGQQIEVLIINFQKNRMVLRIPSAKASNAGLRAVSSQQDIENVFNMLTERVKPTKGIWSRRAQEYETKINSGRLSLLSEVVRELYRKGNQVEQSYSERQIYQNALSRLATEVSAVKSIDFDEACDQVTEVLKST